MNKISKNQIGAYSSLLILLIIKREDSYGYAITQELKQLSNSRIILKEGVIYPILKKLEEKKMIKSYWNLKESDRPRKYYSLLPDGLIHINNLSEEVAFINAIVGQLQSKIKT